MWIRPTDRPTDRPTSDGFTSSDGGSGSGEVLQALQRQEAEMVALREEMRRMQDSLRQVMDKLGGGSA